MCVEFWGISKQAKHIDYIHAVQKEDFSDIGYSIGLEVAKECKDKFLYVKSSEFQNWCDTEIPKYLESLEEKYNYKADDYDKKLIASYIADVTEVKNFFKQKYSIKEICDYTYILPLDVDKIQRYIEDSRTK